MPTANPTHLLIVEDNPADAQLVEAMLRSVDFSALIVHRSSTLAEACEMVLKQPPDVILLDLSLPDSCGIETVSRMLDVAHDLPVIVQTGMGDDALALRAVRLGAQDYVRKGETDGANLARCIRYAVERKRAEREIERQNVELQKTNANLRQLTYAMTHDLQTPLATLTGSVESLSTCLPDRLDSIALGWLDRIEGAAGRMACMLDDLMKYAKGGRIVLSPQPLRISELVADVLNSLEPQLERGNIRITREMSDVEAYADANALRHVLENVIGNAIRYSSADGGAEVDVNVRADHDRVVIRIHDNGPGIKPELLESVFLPFKRANSDAAGTGLGLSIARQYMERMGGAIWLESDGVTGTTAILELATQPTMAEKCAA